MMQQPVTRWEYVRAVIAKWIVINIAARISSLAVLSLCLDIHDHYIGSIEENDE